MKKIKILHFPSAVSFFWPLPHRDGRPPTSFIPPRLPNAGFPEPVDELASFPDVGMKLILSCWFFFVELSQENLWNGGAVEEAANPANSAAFIPSV